MLQTGKREVTVTAIEPVGHYAIKPVFSDGHESGIFTWAYLRELGLGRDALWATYLQKLAAAGASRDVDGATGSDGTGGAPVPPAPMDVVEARFVRK